MQKTYLAVWTAETVVQHAIQSFALLVATERREDRIADNVFEKIEHIVIRLRIVVVLRAKG